MGFMKLSLKLMMILVEILCLSMVVRIEVSWGKVLCFIVVVVIVDVKFLVLLGVLSCCMWMMIVLF